MKNTLMISLFVAMLNTACDTNDYDDKEKQDTTIEQSDADHVDKTGYDSTNMVIDTIHTQQH
ncbi:MAG TPA: hypothetical protein VGF30_06675 [Bacteroidia bacterium]